MVSSFNAGGTHITPLAVHPTQPYVLSSSNDQLIKLWDWQNGWKCTKKFEGHKDIVWQVMFNPKDINTFASVSDDRYVKVTLFIFLIELLSFDNKNSFEKLWFLL